jgi:hypothetical protein
MPMTDIFSSDAFGVVSLTKAINTLPYRASRLGEMGLFSSQGITTTNAVIEFRDGTLALLPSKPRGAEATQAKHNKRKVKSLAVPHIPYEDVVLASDVQNVRKFGSDNEMEAYSEVVNDRLEKMRQQHELTEEWLRIGAIHGKIVDGDGTTTLYDLFTEFGVGAPAAVDFDLGNADANIPSKLLGIKRTIEAALGADQYDHVHALCSATWFDKFVAHPAVKYAYQMFQEGNFLRTDSRKGFEFQGVVFEEYRGKVNNTAFITAGDVRFFPVGVNDLFTTFYAPGNYLDTVNTIGLPIYARQEPMKFNQGMTLRTESNPLPICTRPGVLVRGHSST